MTDENDVAEHSAGAPCWAQEVEMGSIDRILAKWDAQAALQLRAELERMRSAIEAAEARAERAEQEAQRWMEVADAWRDDLLQVIEAAGKQPGLTMEGHIVPVGGVQQAEERLNEMES